MRIIEKVKSRREREITIVEMIPERVLEGHRIKRSFIGLALVGLGVSLIVFPAWFLNPVASFGITRLDLYKLTAVSFIFGLPMLFWALGREVFRAIPNEDIRSGWRLFGIPIFTKWTAHAPMAEDLRIDISRNESSEIFARVMSAQNEEWMKIGPLIDGDQSVTAVPLLSPRKSVSEEELIDPAATLDRLMGFPKPWFRRAFLSLLFGGSIFLAYFDQSWISATLSTILIFIITVLGLLWIAPTRGVDHSTDTGDSIHFWTRQSLFRRQEFRRSLTRPIAPVFLKKSFHAASLGWLALGLLFGALAPVWFWLRATGLY